MQYFTKELWRDMNDEREWIRERAAKEWGKQSTVLCEVRNDKKEPAGEICC